MQLGDDARAYIPSPHRYSVDEAPGGVLRWSRLGVAYRHFREEDGSEQYEVTCDVFASAKQGSPGCYAVWRFPRDELTAKYRELVARPNREALAGMDIGRAVA